MWSIAFLAIEKFRFYLLLARIYFVDVCEVAFSFIPSWFPNGRIAGRFIGSREHLENFFDLYLNRYIKFIIVNLCTL